MNKEYIELLISRMEHFQNKNITDLSDDEIYEYLNLKKEIAEVFPEVKEKVKQIWDAVFEIVKPYADAQVMYKKRVLKNERT